MSAQVPESLIFRPIRDIIIHHSRLSGIVLLRVGSPAF
jgi:hypothetical protein